MQINIKLILFFGAKKLTHSPVQTELRYRGVMCQSLMPLILSNPFPIPGEYPNVSKRIKKISPLSYKNKSHIKED